MKRLSYRNFQNFMLFVTIFVLGFSFYIEYANQLKACPLCLMQRFCTFLFGLSCMVAMSTVRMQRAKTISLIQCVLTLLGLYFGARQLWLQSLPVEQGAQCIPGVEAMLRYFSLDMIITSFLWGSSDCSRVDWQWFGMSIPLWSAIYFIVMYVISLYVYISMRRSEKQGSRF